MHLDTVQWRSTGYNSAVHLLAASDRCRSQAYPHKRKKEGRVTGTLMRMPWEAATPVPTMTAVGVASPRAQGQAITSTAMPNSSAKRKWLWPAGSHSGGYSPCMPATYLQHKRTQI